ncbi:MAG: M18 family aminopeptidase [Cellvibrionales bacterium]|nr:M18 family aminopeptidase [Cellvibrionales bacterium]
MNAEQLNQGLLDFIESSPTPFHAVEQIKSRLVAQGFTELKETEAWTIQRQQGYFVTRNDSSIIAFRLGQGDLASEGMHFLGAHTDSPCLKVKPNADIVRFGYHQVGVEVYGGVLLNPWFDRALSLAGKVSVLTMDDQVEHCLIDFKHPIGMIPSLAIHLDREANQKRTVNPQTDMPVILGLSENLSSFNDVVMAQISKEHPHLKAKRLLDHELSFYDAQKGEVHGINNDFLSAARLDNLLSCYIGLEALLASFGSQHSLFVFNDHEEVGSESAVGAAGPMLTDCLKRLVPDHESFVRLIQHSFMMSADNAHALHPNYPAKHDDKHGPMLGQGPVLKINAKQRYASNTETQSYFRALCERLGVPVQSFVVRADMACGSTIGPITATELGVKTLDIGVPTWAMHSIRETAGTKDCEWAFKALVGFFNRQ